MRRRSRTRSGSRRVEPEESAAVGASRATEGFCTRCNGAVGHFFNLFQKVSGTYYLPVLLGSWSSTLRPTGGRPKPATPGTELDGCLIQPLACPNSQCGEVLGFHVLEAPAQKEAFRDRDFFKLSRIELRCELAPGRLRAVDPHVDTSSHQSLPADDSTRPNPTAAAPAPAPAPAAVVSEPPPSANMEVDARPPPPRHEQPSREHHHHQQPQPHYHQPLQQVEANRQSLPPSIRSPPAPNPTHGLARKSSTNAIPSPSPAVRPVHDGQFVQPQSRESTAGLANRTRELPPAALSPAEHHHQLPHVAQSPAEHHRHPAQFFPRSPQDVSLDAIGHLQTQISQNSGALSVQNREMQVLRDTAAAAQRQDESFRREMQSQLHHQAADVRRIDEAVNGLRYEMRGFSDALDALHRELQSLRAVAAGPIAAGTSVTAQDTALELMAAQIANVSHQMAKVNEVDTLKITLEIMKKKIQRLEEGALAPALAPPPPQPPSHGGALQPAPSYHSTPTPVAQISPPVHAPHRLSSFHSHGSQPASAPEDQDRGEPVQSGWVSVNASAKRAHPNGMESPRGSVGHPAASPKRPKLAPIEPRAAYASPQVHHHHPQVYDHMDTDDSESRMQTQQMVSQTHSHTLPSQAVPSQTLPPQTLPSQTLPSQTLPSQPSLLEPSLSQSTLASQHIQHALYPAPYTTQDAPSDESWRPESQRIIVEHTRTPRGRGRGGPGSRGGRGRKSMPAQIQLGTPEWEREDWQGVPDSQTSPDGYYSHVARSGRGGIIRRGSGGGGSSRGGRPSSSSGRAVSLGMQGVTAGVSVGVGLAVDPYSHTKKTRTKPIRNADGVLIRKDGRPDMRSQSSAANLRKVHARKEEQKGSDGGFTPTSSLRHGTSMGAETPSPTRTSFLPPGHDMTASVQKKHIDVMSKMFPSGIDESRKEVDYSRKVFEDGQDHTAQPSSRIQHHRNKRQHEHEHEADVSQHRPRVKQEHSAGERAQVDDSQSADDGDVDMDRGEHEDDERQTPSDRSDDAAQYEDAEPREDEGVSIGQRGGFRAVNKSSVASEATVHASGQQP